MDSSTDTVPVTVTFLTPNGTAVDTFRMPCNPQQTVRRAAMDALYRFSKKRAGVDRSTFAISQVFADGCELWYGDKLSDVMDVRNEKLTMKLNTNNVGDLTVNVAYVQSGKQQPANQYSRQVPTSEPSLDLVGEEQQQQRPAQPAQAPKQKPMMTPQVGLQTTNLNTAISSIACPATQEDSNANSKKRKRGDAANTNEKQVAGAQQQQKGSTKSKTATAKPVDLQGGSAKTNESKVTRASAKASTGLNKTVTFVAPGEEDALKNKAAKHDEDFTCNVSVSRSLFEDVNKAVSTIKGNFRIGQAVEARGCGVWHSATIIDIDNNNYTCNVKWDTSDESCETVPQKDVRIPKERSTSTAKPAAKPVAKRPSPKNVAAAPAPPEKTVEEEQGHLYDGIGPLRQGALVQARIMGGAWGDGMVTNVEAHMVTILWQGSKREDAVHRKDVKPRKGVPKKAVDLVKDEEGEVTTTTSSKKQVVEYVYDAGSPVRVGAMVQARIMGGSWADAEVTSVGENTFRVRWKGGDREDEINCKDLKPRKGVMKREIKEEPIDDDVVVEHRAPGQMISA